MSRVLRSIVLSALGALALTAGAARADDYAACAKIENAFAYNACLAKQGPAAHGTRAAPAPADADRPYNARGGSGSTMRIARGSHGRMSLQLTIGEPNRRLRQQ